MKIWVYTLCYNEMKILPYIVNYWERYADKVIVYDNGSDDGSQEFLQTIPFVELRHFESDGFNDLMNKNIKNNVWKEAKAFNVDFVQVSDLDEVLYSSLDAKKVCEILKENNMDVWYSHWIEVVAENFPKDINKELFHRSIGFYGNDQGCPDGGSKSKFCLFNPNTINESNFSEGAHRANFKRIDNNDPIYLNIKENLYLLHFDKLGLDYYMEKGKKNGSRLSQINK